MEIEGQTNKTLCTNYVSQKNPVWTNKAEFQTKQPLPTVRVCLRIESNNPLYLEGRPIGEVCKSAFLAALYDRLLNENSTRAIH